jgi:hypothetical protein
MSCMPENQAQAIEQCLSAAAVAAISSPVCLWQAAWPLSPSQYTALLLWACHMQMRTGAAAVAAELRTLRGFVLVVRVVWARLCVSGGCAVEVQSTVCVSCILLCCGLLRRISAAAAHPTADAATNKLAPAAVQLSAVLRECCVLCAGEQ